MDAKKKECEAWGIDALESLRQQAADDKSLAAKQAYIGGLEYELRAALHTHENESGEKMREAVAALRKAAYEFGLSHDPEDQSLMMQAQREIFAEVDKMQAIQQQESEAGAVLYMARNLHSKSYATSRSKAEAELFLLQSGLKVDGKEPVVIPFYAAPPSAQAIETAAIMRAAEAIKPHPQTRPLNYDEARERILALTPQDGRTTLEESSWQLAQAILETRREGLLDGSDIRAIVNQVMKEVWK